MLRLFIGGELYHYGVKGMKWGVRRGKTTSTKSHVDRTVDELSSRQIEKGRVTAEKALRRLPPDIQQFAQKKRRARPMPKVISEIMTHASREERASSMYVTNIGNYSYTVLNRPGDTPLILSKKKIAGTIHDKRGEK